MKQSKAIARPAGKVINTHKRIDFGKLLSLLPVDISLSMAKMLAKSRPLEVYPGWYFGVAEHNPSGMVRLRRAIWAHCRKNQVQKPIVMKWYDGLSINVYLGNDASRCLFIDGCIEPNEFTFLGKVIESGMVFIDGGANDGLYTLFASRCVGQTGAVLAIEPSSREFKRLQANLQLNHLTNVRPLQIALSNRNGSATLQIAGYEHEGQNTLGKFAHEGIECKGTEQTILKRLDDLASEEKLTRVDIIKLDIEGAEFLALEGAEHIFTTFRPLLLLELSDEALRCQGSSAAEMLARLKSWDYAIYAFDSASGELAMAREGEKLSDNIVAAHPDRTWRGLNDNP